MGRPATCDCGECAKCKRRVKAREAYQALGVPERRALVQARDGEKVRAADRNRYERDKPKRRAAMDGYAANNRERVNGHKRAWIERNPEKRKAQVAVGNAVRDGRLVKGPCERADGGGCGGRIEAHHEDYARPLDVTWLCSKHHAETRVKTPG